MDRAETPRSNTPRAAFALGLTALLLVEFIARVLLLDSPPSEAQVRLSLGWEWLLLGGLVLIWIPRIEGLGASSLGLGRVRWRHLAVGIGGYVVSFVPIALLGVLLQSQGLPTLQSMQPLLQGYSLPTLIGLVLTGAVLEELLYRGYLIDRVTRLTGRRWLALLASWLLFTGVHLSFVGFFPMLQIGVLAAFLVWIYEREQSVWPCIVFHGLNSLLVYLVFPLTMP